MPATVIAERIGWTRSITVLIDPIRVLRPLFVPPVPSQRTDYLLGELAQRDLWFQPQATDASIALASTSVRHHSSGTST